MLKKLTALLGGRLRVRIAFAYPERVLNICSARGIPFDTPALLGGDELALSIDRRDWHRLRKACTALGAEAHIERAEGIPALRGAVYCEFLLRLGSARGGLRDREQRARAARAG